MLLASLWVVVAAGFVQVRACVPTVGLLGDAHLLLLRPAADCPSGAALDEGGVLAVVGTVALTTLAAHLAGMGALAGLGTVVARATSLVARLLEAVLPGRRAPGHVVAVVRRAALSGATAVVGAVRGAASSVVGLRAPPLAA
ncbi:hypothetical protein C8046_15825 [Serinibacter arcticus]|uniref:Uncharacterized protein n=1 Tax=Serinibacter arcticus TaxID=1655435 RepID=A0A2U1ZY98_9MICO|nr:hypothetical protein C8046_15825 [Serinibacter arcticus]